jgi:hypothetical protein
VPKQVAATPPTACPIDRWRRPEGKSRRDDPGRPSPVIAIRCLMLGVKASAAQAAPEIVLEYERGSTSTEVADFEAMRQSLPPFKRAAVEALLPWLPEVTGPLPLHDGDVPSSKAAQTSNLEVGFWGWIFFTRSRALPTPYIYRQPHEPMALPSSLFPVARTRGSLAATRGTHFDTVLVPNPDAIGVRPDFMILTDTNITDIPYRLAS